MVSDDLNWILASEAPRLVASCDPNELQDAEFAGRTASGLLAYHAALAERDVESRMKRALGVRDKMMASNLLALVSREREHGPILVFAHNACPSRYCTVEAG